jgi:hypothetical protein
VKGTKDFTCGFDLLSQAGVVIAAPAWCVENTKIDIEVRRVAAVALSASLIVEGFDGKIDMETNELLALAVKCSGDGVVGGAGELVFGHLPGAYLSILGMTTATKGLRGYFILDKITAVIDLKEGRLVVMTVECSGDGSPGLEAVSL